MIFWEMVSGGVIRRWPVPQKAAIVGVMLVVLMGVLAVALTPYMALATGSYALLLAGYLKRKANPRLHASLMGAGVVSDLALVAVLEVKRHAIETVFSEALTPLQSVHVVSSSAAAAMYFPLVVMGLIMLRQPELRPRLRPWHSVLGGACITLRTLGLILMLSMLSRVTTG